MFLTVVGPRNKCVCVCAPEGKILKGADDETRTRSFTELFGKASRVLNSMKYLHSVSYKTILASLTGMLEHCKL